jgi:hypothetical protein
MDNMDSTIGLTTPVLAVVALPDDENWIFTILTA